MRGPIIYCLEVVDNPKVTVHQVTLPREVELQPAWRAGLLGGVTILQAQGLDDQARSVPVTAIPYYAWANREKGPMTVWLKERANAYLKQGDSGHIRVISRNLPTPDTDITGSAMQ